MDYYLKGDNYQAEQILEGLLRRNVRDLDARLMLATCCGGPSGSTKRRGNSTCWCVSRAPGNGKWRFKQERDLLAEARTQKASAA